MWVAGVGERCNVSKPSQASERPESSIGVRGWRLPVQRVTEGRCPKTYWRNVSHSGNDRHNLLRTKANSRSPPSPSVWRATDSRRQMELLTSLRLRIVLSFLLAAAVLGAAAVLLHRSSQRTTAIRNSI